MLVGRISQSGFADGQGTSAMFTYIVAIATNTAGTFAVVVSGTCARNSLDAHVVATEILIPPAPPPITDG